jgi:hypothetical protein
VSITSDAEPRGGPFNEQAALQELERLQRAIEETRRRRKETGDAFDAFVRSFQKERHDARREAQPPVEPAAQAPPAPPAIVDEVVPSASVESALVPAPIAAFRVAPRWKRIPMIPAAAGAAIAIVAAIVLIGRPWATSPSRSGAQNSGSAHTVTRNPESRVPNAEPRMPTAAHSGSAAVAATGVNGELTAIRRVWVRIITDGDRVERELPEGTRVPLHAQRTLTLRIGDAGAVKMVVDNRDQGALGRDGEVVVRTFTAPAR